MRYQGWMWLFAGLLAVPQLALSADGWGGPRPYKMGYAPVTANSPDRSRPAFPGAVSERYAVPRYADVRESMEARGYRFRPWERSAYPSYPSGRRYPIQAGVSQQSYLPRGRAAAVIPAPRSYQPPVWQRQPAPSQGAWQARMERPQPSGNYRFRPVSAPQQAHTEGQVRYRPLQVHIPDGYVFRPLNPVARRSVMPTPAQRPYAPTYPYTPRPYSLGRAGVPAYAYNVSRFPGYAPYPYSAPAVAPWGGRSVRYDQPRRMVQRQGATPGLSPYMNRSIRFRPWPQRVRSQVPMPAFSQRYAQYPVFRRPVQRPVTGYDSGWGSPVRPGYGYAHEPQMAQRSVMPPPARLNRYGTDWYDGQSDSDGAWYRLAVESSPALTHSWQARSSMVEDGAY